MFAMCVDGLLCDVILNRQLVMLHTSTNICL